MKLDENQMALDRLAAAARDGKLTRRSFMNHSIAAGMAVSAATGLWGSSAKAAPQRGGLYRVAQHDGNTADQHDPGQYLSNFEISSGTHLPLLPDDDQPGWHAWRGCCS